MKYSFSHLPEEFSPSLNRKGGCCSSVCRATTASCCSQPNVTIFQRIYLFLCRMTGDQMRKSKSRGQRSSPFQAKVGDARDRQTLTSFWPRDDGSIKSMEELVKEKTENNFQQTSRSQSSKTTPIFIFINLILDNAAYKLSI